jgi:murein DD-endopeptidase MepM/ murein hydrolase activator NlpD
VTETQQISPEEQTPTGVPQQPSAQDNTTGQESAAQAVPESNDSFTFTPFTENDKMIWPVQGELAMAYSMDRLIYDPTLDQYRTNDDIRISAQEGTPVKAGADGKIVEINNNQVYGNYIVVDNGNGWLTTYGQLMDGLLVNEGDIVKAGQVIGGVGKPSAYGALNGTHVNLRITKENEPIDPQTVLLADGN